MAIKERNCIEFNFSCILLLSDSLSFSSLLCSFTGVDSSFHRSIKILQCLKIVHFGTLNTVGIATSVLSSFKFRV